jgi:hypothetical protein
MASLGSAENLETPHFFIMYPPDDAALAEAIVGTLDRARVTLTEHLGVDHESPLKIRLVPSLPRGLALYIPDRKTIEVLTTEAMTTRFGGNPPPLRFMKAVLWHEYVHFLQHRVMKRFIKDTDALWFIEGQAEHFGTRTFMGQYAAEAVWEEGKAILSGSRLPTLEDLNHYHRTNQYPLTTYFFSSDAVAFLVGQWGMEPLRQINSAMGDGTDLADCISENLSIDLATFEGQWHDDLEKRYRRYIRNS